MQAFFTLLSKIQKEQFAPFYLLSGNEPYYIDTVLNAIENKLVEESAENFDNDESSENIEPEFNASTDELDEEFNQETEEELLDIPTFLRRQAN